MTPTWLPFLCLGALNMATVTSQENTCTHAHGDVTTLCMCTADGTTNEFLVSKETVVLRRWERSKQKFGFIKRVDKG